MSVATESNQNMEQNDNEQVKSETDKVEENNEKKSTSPAKKPTVHFLAYLKDMVYVYQFNRCPALPSFSPYCLKVETWLRMAGVNYQNIDHKMKYKSKKNQLPFVELNGVEIADSEIIISELSKYFNKNLDEGLTSDQLNVSHAFRSMLDNSTYWMVRCWRYKNPSEFMKVSKLDVKKTINSKLPKVVLSYLFKFGLKNNVKQTIVHGIGRHSMEEIISFGKKDITALSAQLGDKDFFFGNKPHMLDCTAFAHLCQLIYVPFADFDKWLDQEVPNLVKFVQRMKERYWTDWDDICKTLDMNTHIVKTEAQLEEAKKQEEAKEEERKKKELKKEKEEKKRKEKEEREEKKKKEKEEKERKRKEAKEKAEKEKAEKAAAEKKAKEEASKQSSGEGAGTTSEEKTETKEGEEKTEAAKETKDKNN